MIGPLTTVCQWAGPVRGGAKQSNDADVGEPIGNSTAVSETYEDNIEDEFDSPGIFCYQTCLELPDSTEAIQGAASNWVCLTEEPVV